jgi:hypothetical protein
VQFGIVVLHWDHNEERKPGTMKDMTDEVGQIQAENSAGKLILKSKKGKGWQIVRDCNPKAVEQAVKSMARQLKLKVKTNKWDDGTTLTFKVD